VVKCCLAITRLMSLTPIPQKRKKECERNQWQQLHITFKVWFILSKCVYKSLLFSGWSQTLGQTPLPPIQNFFRTRCGANVLDMKNVTMQFITMKHICKFFYLCIMSESNQKASFMKERSMKEVNF
jgi:hypothetical protein